MINKFLCSALLVIAPVLSPSAFSQTRKHVAPVASENPIEDFDWETEVESDQDLGYDDVPSGFDMTVEDALDAQGDETGNWEAEGTEFLEEEDLMAIAMNGGTDEDGYTEIAFGNVDPVTIEFFEDFETYFDNFDGSEWTDELWAEGNVAEEESQMNEEAMRPLKDAIEDLEFQLEADWENYSKDQASEVSVNF